MNYIWPNAASHPYFIIAPPYDPNSAGVKVLHHLCHSLNLLGHRAYVISDSINAELVTPQLTTVISNMYYQRGKTPIMIYPEVVSGNPLNAPFVVRYLLNYTGILGGPKEWDQQDYILNYSNDLKYDNRENQSLLYYPIHDYFAQSNEKSLKGNRRWYGTKFTSRGGKASEYFDTLSVKEIPGYIKAERNKQKYWDMLAQSECVYFLDNSGIMIDAMCLGIPCVIFPTTQTPGIIGAQELDQYPGLIRVNHESELTQEMIDKARIDVILFKDKYKQMVRHLPIALNEFVRDTQIRASQIEYKTEIHN